MRMEAKNAYCKQIARSSNFKNVPYSVAQRHQRKMCAYLHSGNFFDRELQYGPGKLLLYIVDYMCSLNSITSIHYS